MEAILDSDDDAQLPVKSRSYDPNNLSAEDEECRKHDDTSEGIDWDEIIATTQDDWEAGRFSFKSSDYATDGEASAALGNWIHSIAEEVLREATPETTHDAAGP